MVTLTLQPLRCNLRQSIYRSILLQTGKKLRATALELIHRHQRWGVDTQQLLLLNINHVALA